VVGGFGVLGFFREVITGGTPGLRVHGYFLCEVYVQGVAFKLLELG